MNAKSAVVRGSLRVCGNAADMRTGTRYARHFHIDGDNSRHFGWSDCGPKTAKFAILGNEASCC